MQGYADGTDRIIQIYTAFAVPSTHIYYLRDHFSKSKTVRY